MMNQKQVEDAFTPTKPDQVTKIALLKIENASKDFAGDILVNAPDCPMRTIALNKLLEVKWACAQAISHPDNHNLGVGK